MTQLFIGGKEVALPTGFSFNLTEENPYFTQAGQYSDELEIPLLGSNVKIFGPLTRRDVTLKDKTYDARIVVNNRSIVVGTATVTAVNDTTISIQILGNNSDINYLSQFNNIYIDEMDLGYACAGYTGYTSQTRSTEHIVTYYTWETKQIKIKVTIDGEVQSETISTKDDVAAFYKAAHGSEADEIKTKLLGPSSSVNFVCLPAVPNGSLQIPRTGSDGADYITTIDNAVVNNFMYKIDREYNWDSLTDILFSQQTWMTEEHDSGSRAAWEESALSDYVAGDKNYIIPQPYMAYVIERFVAELGYTISDSDLRADWLKNAYLANVTYTTLIQQMLPHWTATEFMTQIEHLYGVVFWFDSKTKVCRIKKRAAIFADAVRMSSVNDSFSVDVEEDSTTDISNANVTIDYGDDLLHHFDDTIRDNATEVECDGISGVESFLTGSEPAPDGSPIKSCVALRRSESNTNATCRKYILKDSIVTPCDQMGDLIRGEDNDEIELKLQPSPITTHEAYVIYPRKDTLGTQWMILKNDYPILFRTPKVPPVPLRKNYLDLGAYINGTDSENDNTVDKMYIAMYDGIPTREGTYSGGDNLTARVIPEHMGWCWEQDDLTGLHFMNHSDTLQLYGEATINCLEKNWTTVNIDTTRKHTFNFYVDTPIDVRNILVIDGKRYVVESVKYTLDENGLNKLAECVLYKFVE